MATTADDPITQDKPAQPDLDLPIEPVRPSRALRSRTRPAGPRRTKVTVRRFGVLSVLKGSLVFSFCAMLVIWLALLMIYLVLQAGGVIDDIASSELVSCFVNEAEGTKGCPPVQVDGGRVFTYLFFACCAAAVLVALLITFTSIVYNLIGDLVGGVEVTLSERERRR
jgi:hypothetical protein